MATPTKYTYTKSPVNTTQLAAEIQASTTIIVGLQHIDTLGTSVDVWMKDVLSTDQESALTSLVTAHIAVPTPNPIQIVDINSIPAFASKTIGAKRLFKRVVGIQSTLVAGDNTITWACTFDWVKFMAIEVINGQVGDYVSLKVLDTVTGTYSTVPNYPLNQFGFSANLAADFYVHKSEFDADIFKGLQVQIVYHSISAKTVGINFVMNEVK